MHRVTQKSIGVIETRVDQCRWSIDMGKGMTKGQKAHWNIVVHSQGLTGALFILQGMERWQGGFVAKK